MWNVCFKVCQYTVVSNDIVMVFQQYYQHWGYLRLNSFFFGIATVVMEQPPGSLDDLQPQDLSTSSSASVIDLTKKGEGCVYSKEASADTLPVASNWCPNSDTGNPSPTSDILLPPGEDHIRPDIALSHTTVTVSYVSRSHVISSHDSLSQHLPLCGVPAIGKLHVCPPGYSDTGLRETGIPLDQQYLDKVDRPVVLATQTELFQTSSAAQVGPESFGSDQMRGTNEVNGGVASPDWVLNEHVLGREEHSLPLAKAKGLENGQIDSCSSSGVCAEWSPETLAPAAGENEDTGGTEVLFLMSKTKDSVILPDGLAARDPCSQERDYISPLDDPVSPSPTSQGNIEDMFVLPQASSSPSGDNSYLQMSNEAAWDGTSTPCVHPLDSLVGGATTWFPSSDKDAEPVQKQKAPLIDLTDDVCTSNDVESKVATPHMNGNAETLQRALEGKRLRVRSGRGTQSEVATVDMNLNSQFTSDEKNDTPRKRNRMRKAKVLGTAERAAEVPVKSRKSDDTSTDNHRDSTSDSEANNFRKSPSSTRAKSPRLTAAKQTPPERLSPPLVSSAAKRNVTPLSEKSPKRSCSGAKGSSAGRKTPPTTKRKRSSTPRKRCRRRRQTPTSNMFSPKEPEIKLRYINFKEEKRRCGSVDSFSPFVHVERQPQQQPSLCTIINYPEEVSRATQPRSRQPTQPTQSGGFVSTAVPSTSCMQLGRVAAHSQHHRVLVCCLCGLSANAMYLGDLHGPYYPEGFQSAAKLGDAGSERLQGEQGDERDDSDASSRSIRARRRKRAVPLRSQSSGVALKGRDLRTKRRRSTDGPGGSPTKWARSDAGSSTTCSAEDWYSPPLLPADPCEFWLHEDCGIWSTGVFLVRGRVYGLKEAVRAAQETVRPHSETARSS